MSDFLLKDFSFKPVDRLKYIQDKGWKFSREDWNLLSEDEKAFIFIEFYLTSPEYYVERLKAIGFNDMDTVVDAACGNGKWSLSLGRLNRKVLGFDLDRERLSSAELLLANHSVDNVSFTEGNLEVLPFDSGIADGLFCYSAIMFADMRKAIAEFQRVLKPGGRLYLNYNHYGWYAHLFIDRGLKKGNLNLMKVAVKWYLNTLAGKNQRIIVSNSYMDKLLAANGFKILAKEAEGKIELIQPTEPIIPFIKKRFYGLPAVVEIVAEKQE